MMTFNSLIKVTAIVALGVLTGCQAGSSTSTANLDNPANTIELREGMPAAKHHFRAGNYGLSERNYRFAIESNASNAEAWLGLGATYDQLGRYDLAERSYKQVLKITGPIPQLMNNMGYSQMLRGKRKKARSYFAKAHKALPDSEIVSGNRELLAKL